MQHLFALSLLRIILNCGSVRKAPLLGPRKWSVYVNLAVLITYERLHSSANVAVVVKIFIYLFFVLLKNKTSASFCFSLFRSNWIRRYACGVIKLHLGSHVFFTSRKRGIETSSRDTSAANARHRCCRASASSVATLVEDRAWKNIRTVVETASILIVDSSGAWTCTKLTAA